MGFSFGEFHQPGDQELQAKLAKLAEYEKRDEEHRRKKEFRSAIIAIVKEELQSITHNEELEHWMKQIEHKVNMSPVSDCNEGLLKLENKIFKAIGTIQKRITRLESLISESGMIPHLDKQTSVDANTPVILNKSVVTLKTDQQTGV